MAPTTKRKRGRPSHASREDADASGPSTALIDATNLPPRKRTRRSPDNERDATNDTEKPAKKPRGRPAAAKTRTNENDENAEAQPAQPKKKRGRPSLQNNDNVAERSQAEKPKKKRGRPSLEGREVNDGAPSGTPKKRGRKAKDAEVEEDTQAQEPTKKKGRRIQAQEVNGEVEPAQRKKKTGQVSSQEAEAGAASNRTKKTKAKPATTDVEEDDATTAEPAKKTKRGPKKSSWRQSGESQGSQDAATSLYRRRSSLNSAISVDHDPSPPPSPKRPYLHLAPKVRRIRRSLITKKWSPLPASSITLANTLLTLAHRPILQRLSSSSQRLIHTQSALRLLTNRITRRLKNALPFPPAGAPNITRDMELNFEVVLKKKEKLEGQLDPVVHAVELLKREKGRVERELEQDYRTLRNLEAGISQDRREKGRLLKKAHGLAPRGLRAKKEEDRDEEVYFEKGEKGSTQDGIFTGIGDDEDVKDVVMQLSGHVDSMKANLQQADGVAEGIERARAAVQEVLLKHLTQEQYEKVVLG